MYFEPVEHIASVSSCEYDAIEFLSLSIFVQHTIFCYALHLKIHHLIMNQINVAHHLRYLKMLKIISWLFVISYLIIDSFKMLCFTIDFNFKRLFMRLDHNLQNASYNI